MIAWPSLVNRALKIPEADYPQTELEQHCQYQSLNLNPGPWHTLIGEQSTGFLLTGRSHRDVHFLYLSSGKQYWSKPSHSQDSEFRLLPKTIIEVNWKWEQARCVGLLNLRKAFSSEIILQLLLWQTSLTRSQPLLTTAITQSSFLLIFGLHPFLSTHPPCPYPDNQSTKANQKALGVIILAGGKAGMQRICR